MRSIRFNRILTIGLTLLANAVNGQFQEPPKTLPSPNAASLGTYGEIPISLFTGLPQVNIPIYAADNGGIQIPISLNYHAAGVQIDQRPGWVGLNFNLDAGGSITRTVKDQPDDDPTLFSGHGVGFFFNGTLLNSETWSSKSNIHALGETLEFLLDLEPDEFNFNFLGYSGTFYLDWTNPRQFKVRSDDNFKVELIIDELNAPNPKKLQPPFLAISASSWFRSPNEESYLGHFAGFKLTADDGTEFIFGNTTSAVEYSMNFFNQDKDTWIANTWNLVKVVTKDGREVTFNYQRGPFVNQMFYSVLFKDKIVKGSRVAFGAPFFPRDNQFTPNCFEFSSGVPAQGVFDGKLIAPVYLTDIVLSDGSKILFSRSSTVEMQYDKTVIYDPFHDFRSLKGLPDYRSYLCFLLYDQQTRTFDTSIPYASSFNSLVWQKLDQIEVRDPGNKRIAQYVFDYNNDPTQRLMLKSLLTIDIGSQQGNQEHRFFYDTSQPLPPYLVHFTDHFGYYNGKLTPQLIGDWSAFHSYREPNALFAKAGILNKIVYPTGGVTDFDYEVHSYSKEVDVERHKPLITHDEDKTTGGLRIKKVTSYDPKRPTEKLTREYLYVSGYDPVTRQSGLSSGILGGRAQYYWGEFTTEVPDTDPVQVFSEEVLSSHSILPMSENAAGSHIGYSEVVEQFSNGSTIVHKFSNFDNGHMDEPFINTLHVTKTPYEPYVSKAFERGKPLGRVTYDDAGRRLESVDYEYAPLRKDSVRAVRVNRILTCENSFQFFVEGTSYKIYTYPFLLKSEHVRVYDVLAPQKFIDLGTSYKYNDENLPWQITESKSGNQDLITELKYPMDFDVASANDDDPNIVGLKMLQDQHIRDEVIEKFTYQMKQVAGSAEPIVLSATLSTHRKNESNASQVVTDEVFELELPAPLPKQGFTGSNTYTGRLGKDTRYRSGIKFDRYDNFGNVIQYTPRSLPPISLQWGYGKLFPVARIENAAADQFFYTSFEEGDGNSVEMDSRTGKKSKLNDFSHTMVIASPGRYELSYWKKIGTRWEHFAKPETITSSTYTIDLQGQVDEVRFYPKGAMMSTFTFSPHIGMTSSTDANSQTRYFEHDGLRRLKLIRDNAANIVKRYDYQLRKAAQ